MSAKSKKTSYHGSFPLQEPELDRVPKSGFIKFNLNLLEPKRRIVALKQILIYQKKIKWFPLKKSLYLEKINELIIYEKEKRWKV